jgi:Carboxypeptidase regulatory-like domain
MKQILLGMALIGALAFAACGTNPNGPERLTGNLHGGIELRDECNAVAGSFAGVKITIEGTSFSAVTDANGIWEVKNLPAGTYVISYSKDGYFTEKIEGYQFVGGGDAYVANNRFTRETSLNQVPTWTFGQIEALRGQHDSTNTPAPWVILRGTMTPSTCGAGRYRTLVLFLSDNSGVSTTSYKKVMPISVSGDTQFNATIGSAALRELGFASGSTVHAIAVPATHAGVRRDPATGKEEFQALGSTPSNAVSFVAP